MLSNIRKCAVYLGEAECRNNPKKHICDYGPICERVGADTIPLPSDMFNNHPYLLILKFGFFQHILHYKYIIDGEQFINMLFYAT